MKDGKSSAAAPKREWPEEPCRFCDGAGCDACNETGMQYTEQAIRDQIALEEEHEDADA